MVLQGVASAIRLAPLIPPAGKFLLLKHPYAVPDSPHSPFPHIYLLSFPPFPGMKSFHFPAFAITTPLPNNWNQCQEAYLKMGLKFNKDEVKRGITIKERRVYASSWWAETAQGKLRQETGARPLLSGQAWDAPHWDTGSSGQALYSHEKGRWGQVPCPAGVQKSPASATPQRKPGAPGGGQLAQLSLYSLIHGTGTPSIFLSVLSRWNCSLQCF